MQSLAVKGGIGDFLQCLPYMLAHPEHRYLVASHQDCVQEFFGAVGLQVEELSLGRMNGIELCPRATFFERNPFPPINGSPMIGVHLGGSSYSTNIERRFGFPSKALPAAVMGALKSSAPYHTFRHFGPQSPLNLSQQLSLVSKCKAFIGSDSAFKTMSAMLKIPTVVWIGDYKDDDRDKKFIEPYVEAGVMSVFPYKALSPYDIWLGTKFSLDWINAQIA